MGVRLDVGGVLERVFSLYRQHWAVLLPAALAVFVVIDLLEALALNGSSGIVGLIALVVLGWIGTIWYQGVVVETVAESRSSARRLEIRDLFRAVMPRIWPLALAGLLAGIGIGIGFILIIVPGLILLTLWALIAPVIVLEGAGVFESFGRSRVLVRGNGWRVFGVVVVIYIIQAVVTGILERIGAGSFVGYWITVLIATVLTAPLSALAATIMYFDLLGSPATATAGGAEGAPIAGGWEPPASPGGAAITPGAREPLFDQAAGTVERPYVEPVRARDPVVDEPAVGAEHAAAETPAAEPRAAEPVAPAEAPTHPADWYPDPRGEKRLRYWDGHAWTSYTAD